MIDDLKEHLAKGGSINSFCGEHKIHQESWRKIMKENAELSLIKKEYIDRVNKKRRFPN